MCDFIFITVHYFCHCCRYFFDLTPLNVNLLQVPQLTESFQVILMNATGQAELGADMEATLIVKNHNFAIYFNGYYLSIKLFLLHLCVDIIYIINICCHGCDSLICIVSSLYRLIN